MALAPHHFCLSWKGHQKHMSSMFEDLLMEEALVDVTLACEGSLIKAHKTVLSAGSPYFKLIFTSNPCPHPVIVLKDIAYEDMMTVVNFMYRGMVNASKDRFPALLDIAKTLEIVGLTEAVKLVTAQWPQKETSSAKRSLEDQQRTKRRRRSSQQNGGTSGDDEEAQPSSADALKIVNVKSLITDCEQPWNKDDFVIKHFEDQIEFHPSIASQQNLSEDSGSSFRSAENAQAYADDGLTAGQSSSYAATSFASPSYESDSTAEMRFLFESTVNELSSVKRCNTCILTKEKYNKLLEDVKRINTHGSSFRSDYRKKRRYQLAIIDGSEKLVKMNTSLVFIPQTELFDVIHRTHIRLGHAGRNALKSSLSKSFANITIEIIMAYLILCKECQKKHGGTSRESEVT